MTNLWILSVEKQLFGIKSQNYIAMMANKFNYQEQVNIWLCYITTFTCYVYLLWIVQLFASSMLGNPMFYHLCLVELRIGGFLDHSWIAFGWGRGGEGRNDWRSNRAKRNEMQRREDSNGFLPNNWVWSVYRASIISSFLKLFMAGVFKLI